MGKGRYPDFLCMGFQKCGTTTLFEIFNKHPEIALCADVKEPMYYRVIFARYLGLRWYYKRRYFGFYRPGDTRVYGEVNAGLTFTDCARKISKDFPPETKMIFMMREPVARTFSAYKYFLVRGQLPQWAVEFDLEHGHAQGFDYYVHRILDSREARDEVMEKRLRYEVLSQSNYATCIEEYLQNFPKEQMRFVLFEDFIRDQHAVCRELYDFIGVQDRDDIDYQQRSNEGNWRATSYKAVRKAKVAKGWNVYGWNEFALMGHWAPGLAQKFRGIYLHYRDKSRVPDTDKSKVLPETRAYLQEYFNGEVRRLEQIMGRDLSQLWF